MNVTTFFVREPVLLETMSNGSDGIKLCTVGHRHTGWRFVLWWAQLADSMWWFGNRWLESRRRRKKHVGGVASSTGCIRNVEVVYVWVGAVRLRLVVPSSRRARTSTLTHSSVSTGSAPKVVSNNNTNLNKCKIGQRWGSARESPQTRNHHTLVFHAQGESVHTLTYTFTFRYGRFERFRQPLRKKSPLIATGDSCFAWRAVVLDNKIYHNCTGSWTDQRHRSSLSSPSADKRTIVRNPCM